MASPKILVFIPAYNCERQIERVLNQLRDLPQFLHFEALVLDNQSTDETLSNATKAAEDIPIKTTVARNISNYGLGGSHKAAFKFAISHDFSHIIILHGDDQGSIRDLIPHLISGKFLQYDAFMGARFMKGSSLQGYSHFRTFGNIVYNLLFSLVTRRKLYDLGSGLNVLSVEALKSKNWITFGNDLTFNYYLILAICNWNWKLSFFPISWREDDQISNVKLFKQAKKTIGILWNYLTKQDRFLTQDHAGPVVGSYQFQQVNTNLADHG